jgi:hypothetical protein
VGVSSIEGANSRWPSREDADGKIQYFNIFEFGDRAARDRFSASVIDAVRATDDGRRALGAGKPQPGFDDEITF